MNNTKTNIERAIELLSVITSTRCGNEFSNHYLIDTNDCRVEIVALMQAIGEEVYCSDCPDTIDAWNALATKILEGEKI